MSPPVFVVSILLMLKQNLLIWILSAPCFYYKNPGKDTLRHKNPIHFEFCSQQMSLPKMTMR
jgi:hypothetical protein